MSFAKIGLWALLSCFFGSVPSFAQDQPERYLVKFRHELAAQSLEAQLERAGVKIERIIPEISVFVLTPKAEGVDLSALRKIAAEKQIEFLEKDEKRWRAEAVPSDPMYAEQYALRKIDAERAWDVTTGSSKVIVAVTDTGVEASHPDLRNRIWRNAGEIAGNGLDDDDNGFVDDVYGWDFVGNDADPSDENGHGTHVAGIIGAEANNALGVAGVAWNVRIMPLRFLDARGSGSDSAGAEAIIYAAKNGARIINASWGSTSNSRTVQEAVSYAQRRGAIVVAAAGNDNKDTDRTLHYPSTYADISVAASDQSSQKASFSNYGRGHVDVAAPGVSVLSTYTPRTWKKLSGTSMASPVVAGIAALVLAEFPELAGQDLRNLLLDATISRPSFTGRISTDGEVNAALAMDRLEGEFQVWPRRIALIKGESFNFTPYRAKGDVSWTSSDPAIATISGTGELQTLQTGPVTVVAEDRTGARASVTVQVVEVRPSTGCATAPPSMVPTGRESLAGGLNLALPLLVGWIVSRRRRK